MGLTPGDVGQLLQFAWAGTYVNDFLDQGRIKRVYVQGEAEARATPSDIEKWRVRNASGGLVPFSNFATGTWDYGAQGLYRYNGIPSVQVQGSPAPGVTTGEAMAEMERLTGELGPGYQLSWTGLSLEERESGNQAPLLYALSLAAVFLSLAALYESWVDSVRGHAGHAHRDRRRADRRVAGGIRERGVLPGRPADRDRPDRQERDPDRGRLPATATRRATG